MDKKTRYIYIHTYTHTHTVYKRHTQIKSKKDGRRYFVQIEKGKKAGVAILIFDKIDFKIKAVIRDKEGHYIKIKGTIQQEDITLGNIYAPKYVKQILMDIKGEIGTNTVVVHYFNTPLTPTENQQGDGSLK